MASQRIVPFVLAMLSVFLGTICHPVSAYPSVLCDAGCSGHGTCSATGTCACNHDWAGRDCGFFIGMASNEVHSETATKDLISSSACLGGCSARGSCVAGTCVCQPGFFGPSCADAQCPGACFGHGSCDQGTCLCNSGWMGKSCEMRLPQLVQDNSVLQSHRSVETPRTPQLILQKAQQATRAAQQVAEQLKEAAAQENERDAARRMERALKDAHKNWDKLPGHEFGPKPAATSDLALLSQSASVGSKSNACRSDCSGHGTCNSATGQCNCHTSWVGDTCDVQRCPADCAGKGMCLAGKCICNPQHFGETCQHARCPQDCSGHGFCFNGKCQCSGSYGGEGCLTQLHSSNVVKFRVPKDAPKRGIPLPSSSLRASELTASSQQESLLGWEAKHSDSTLYGTCKGGCNQRGSCIKGQCLCYAGFFGSDCKKVGACHAHGKPVASLIQGGQTTCQCDPGWSGPDCNVETVCADQTCSGHGICTYGRCTCGAGYSGHSCHVSLLSCEYRCGSHGSCSSEDTDSQCKCHKGWAGSRCDVERLQCENNCNGHGTCMDGVCSCSAPFEGSSCNKLSYLVTGENSTQTKSKPAVLLGMQKTTLRTESNSTANQSLQVNKTEDSESTPMTASWLTPSTLIRAAGKAPKLQKSNVPSMPSSSEASKTAAANEDALWHPAIVPPASAAIPKRTEGPLLSLLSSKPKTSSSGTEAWKERPLARDHEQSQQQSQPTPQAVLPKKLVSLLSLSPKAPPLLSASMEEPDSKTSDIDALLTGI